MLKKSKIKKILVISLTNIGDIVLTFPVVDILRNDFPDADMSIVIGPKGESLFKENPHIKNIYIFHKRQPFLKTFKWLLNLRREHFDLVIDLRNTAIPFFLGAKYTTSPFLRRTPDEHMGKQHLERLKSVYDYLKEPYKKYSLFIPEHDEKDVDNIINDEVGGQKHEYIVVAPGAADIGKRWSSEGFAKVCDQLADKYHFKIVFAGDTKDRKKVQKVIKKMSHHGVNLSGRLDLTQFGHLLKHSRFLISNDSAPMHIASYLDVPVLGLFGPTDPAKYGPWGETPYFIKKDVPENLSPSEKMKAITVEDVLEKVDQILKGSIKK